VRRETSAHADDIDWVAVDALGLRRLTSDSRALRAGDTFVAYPGETRDGRDFIAQAIAAGAHTVLWESANFHWQKKWRVRQLGVRGLRHKIGAIASHVYGRPSSRLWMMGVTGTNGKTSCSHWIAQAFNQLGRRCAVAGTLGNGFPEALKTGVNTTPDAAWLHGQLREWYGDGARAVAMEVSSHGLEQGRVAGVEFDVAMFTNLTRDHLDYHGTMAKYRRAKAKLFAWETLKWSVFNLDDAFGAALAGRQCATGSGVLGYGFSLSRASKNLPCVQGRNLRLSLDGIRFEAVTPWGVVHVRSAALGRFNASNLLGTLAVLLVSGVSVRDAEHVLAALKPVPGRAQFLGGGKFPLVVVDYAHTPDALEKMLLTLREIGGDAKRKKLTCVFGCGGDRDRGKRAMMGRIATRIADNIVVTSDNPRNEDPQLIIADILKGISRKCAVIESRAHAVQQTIAGARRGDIVLIAGKGHEPYQEIKGVRHRYSDVATAAAALSDLAGVAA
jgi:UDP-N-acetylmuramoyl-L-alanyl-D-glutamate--2,6-diaminopimelate ligase